MPEQRSRFNRSHNGRVHLQARDADLLAALLQCRCLTTSMIAAGFFPGVTAHRCRRRLRQLFDQGLVERHFLPTAPYGSEAIYTLGRAGLPVALERLAEDGATIDSDDARAQIPMPPLGLLSHSLAVARIFLACREHLDSSSPVRMARWLFERQVCARFDVRAVVSDSARPRPWRSVAFKPDAAILASGPNLSIRTIFVEADCRTEGARKLWAKFEAHRIYLASGQFAKAYGQDSFRTLALTTGPDGRVRAIAAAAERAEAGFVLAAAMDDFKENGPLECRCLRSGGNWTSLADALA